LDLITDLLDINRTTRAAAAEKLYKFLQVRLLQLLQRLYYDFNDFNDLNHLLFDMPGKPVKKKMTVVFPKVKKTAAQKKAQELVEDTEEEEEVLSPPASPRSVTPPPENPDAQGTAAAAAALEADIPALQAGPSKSKRKKSKTVVLTDEQEVEVGEWLRMHPELYTKGLKGYKEVAKKQKLWADKTEELKLESVVLLKTWYESIRTKIGKMKKTKSGTGTKDTTDRDKFVMANFGFLVDHISRMRGRTACSVSKSLQCT
jgi:hypothetical protein